jgi:hypothetical protein
MTWPGLPSGFQQNYWRINQLIPPAQEPVTLSDAKNFARIEFDNDDATVTDLITAAREYAEVAQKRAIPTQVFQMYMMGFSWSGGYYDRIIRSIGPSPWWLPSAQGIMTIPHPNVQMVLSVQYIDPSSGLWDYVQPSTYTFSYNSTPGRISPIEGAVWPLPRPQQDNVIITFVSGYGPTAQGSAQSQTLAVQGVATSGTFVLSWNGDTTTNLNWNCQSSDIQTALQALGNIGANNVTCIGGPFPVAPIIATWAGTLASGYQPLITATSNLSGIATSQPSVLTNIAPLMPSSTRTALKQIVADTYENREASMDITLKITPTSNRMLQPEMWGSYV